MNKVKPDFIVPGFPKCGTTWLYANLNKLPEFAMPTHKELHFFNRDPNYYLSGPGQKHSYFKQRKRLLDNFGFKGYKLYSKHLKFWEKNDQTYLELFENEKKYIGDITPIYVMMEDEGIKKIASKINGTKVIFIIRDPIERSWSKFKMEMRKKNHQINQYSEAEIIKFFENEVLIKIADYKKGIEMFQNAFTKSEIKLFFYDHISEKPEVLLNNILSFITEEDISCENLDLKKRVNAATHEIEMPKEVLIYLKDTLQKQYQWLIKIVPEIKYIWYDKHFNSGSIIKSDMHLPDYVNLN